MGFARWVCFKRRAHGCCSRADSKTAYRLKQYLPETKKGVAHKAPNYYKFDLKNYKKALKGGMGFEL